MQIQDIRINGELVAEYAIDVNDPERLYLKVYGKYTLYEMKIYEDIFAHLIQVLEGRKFKMLSYLNTGRN